MHNRKLFFGAGTPKVFLHACLILFFLFDCCALYANDSAPTLIMPVIQYSAEKKALKAPSIDQSLLLDIELIEHESLGSRLLIVGDRGQIFYASEPNGLIANWVQAQVPTQNLLTAVTSFGETAWAVGHDGIILQSDDFGEYWRVQHIAPHAQYVSRAKLLSAEGFSADLAGMPLLDIKFVSDNIGFAVGAYGYFLMTEDGGKQWENVSARIDNIDGFHLNVIQGVNDKVIWIAGEGGVIFHSLDGGSHWARITTPYVNSWLGLELGLYPEHIYAYGIGGTIIESQDKGQSWQRLSLLDPTSKEAITDGVMGSSLLQDRTVLFVGNGGLNIHWNVVDREAQIHYTNERNTLSSVTSDAKSVWAVGQGGVYSF